MKKQKDANKKKKKTLKDTKQTRPTASRSERLPIQTATVLVSPVRRVNLKHYTLNRLEATPADFKHVA